MFLYESWSCSNSNISLNVYTTHNFYRMFKHRNAKRNSGQARIQVGGQGEAAA